MFGLIGKKEGMTQFFGANGDHIPVTVIRVGPCTVVQKKTAESDGYDALQLGYGPAKKGRMPKPRRCHFEKRNLQLFAHLCEFRTEKAGEFAVGDELCVAGFKEGDKVHVAGITKGRGFQGVIKRHGKHGGPASHGSDFHRRPGSIGMRTWPARVLKNTRLPGHMGTDRVTVRNLTVVAVRPEDDVLLVKGAIPGAGGGLVVVTAVDREFESRAGLKRKAAEAKSGEERKD